MTGLRRTPRIGKVLAAGALIGLAGCHQVPSRPGAPSLLGFGNEPKGGGTTITPAQEADVQISMGRVAEQRGDLDQAMAAYRAALDRDKSRADAYARLAILHDKQGKFRESADLYRKALALRPGDPDIFCDMGYSFYLQRRWAEAEMNLRQSLAVNPEHRRAHNNLALLLVRDNRLGDALAEFGKAGSDPVQAHMNLAFALTIDQRWESARAEYQRALALDPSSQLAKARLDELNNLLAKREPAAPAPDGARRDPPLLTAATATAAPTARRGPDGTTAAATPPQSVPSGPRRDPALLATTAVSPSPPQGYRPRTRVAVPSVPAEDGAMQRLWSTADSASGAPPTPRPDARARNTAPTAPPQRRDSHPQPDAAPPDDSSTLPLLAIDSPGLAQAGTRGPDRASIPPPQSFEALRTARPDAHPPAVSTPIAPPGALRRPTPQRPARPRLRTRTRTPWIRPGNPPSAPDGPGDPDDRSPVFPKLAGPSVSYRLCGVAQTEKSSGLRALSALCKGTGLSTRGNWHEHVSKPPPHGALRFQTVHLSYGHAWGGPRPRHMRASLRNNSSVPDRAVQRGRHDVEKSKQYHAKLFCSLSPKYARNHLLLCLKEGVPLTRDSMSAAVMMMLGLEESPRPASPDFYTQRRLRSTQDRFVNQIGA